MTQGSSVWRSSPLKDVRVFIPEVSGDSRGEFVKTFHEEVFGDEGIHFDLREEFYSVSKKDVIRGMHFQTPPHAHSKLVICLAGGILDVLLDLRAGLPTYGQVWTVELTSENRNVLYIPEGIAHGFLSLSDHALVHYKTTAVYSPDHDTGVRWDSIDFTWPVKAPVLSLRDSDFIRFQEFVSPFE